MSAEQERRHDVPMLEVRGVDAAYGPLQILFGVDLVVERGAQVALLGTNGAGKSTLLRVIGGLLEPSAGTVTLAGQELAGVPAYERVGLGMTLVEGGKATFPSLTVAENLRLGAYRELSGRDRVEEQLAEVLDLFPPLRPRIGQAAGTLSGGEQQMMAIGRALMSDPALLMIDELSLGLAPVVMQDILAVIEELARRGTTILLVEQSLNVALSVASTAYFMEKGEVRFSGPSIELLERGDLVRSVFFGDRADNRVADDAPSRRTRPLVAPGRGGNGRQR